MPPVLELHKAAIIFFTYMGSIEVKCYIISSTVFSLAYNTGDVHVHLMWGWREPKSIDAALSLPIMPSHLFGSTNLMGGAHKK